MTRSEALAKMDEYADEPPDGLTVLAMFVALHDGRQPEDEDHDAGMWACVMEAYLMHVEEGKGD